jgi:hypothetical protein
MGSSKGHTGPLLVHKGKRTVVIRDCGGRYISEAGAGKVFLENCTGGNPVFGKGQKVWARSFNTEDARDQLSVPMVEVNGAHVWCLGQKTEIAKNMWYVHNGGVLELLGSCYYGIRGTGDQPLYKVVDSHIFACAYVMLWSWKVEVEETRSGVTRTKPGVTYASTAAYSGWDEATLPDLTTNTAARPKPSPSAKVAVKGTKNYTYSIVDLRGRMVVKQAHSTAKLPSGLIGKGAYIQIRQDNSVKPMFVAR